MRKPIRLKPGSPVAAGIDISKLWLDVALSDGRRLTRRRNDRSGHALLTAELTRLGIGKVGFEATGGYERQLAHALRQAGLQAIVWQPRQVRAYALYQLKLDKSDPIDAGLIAQCTAEWHHPRPAPDLRLEPLAALLTVIEQIEEDIARHRIRNEQAACPQAAVHNKKMVKLLLAERRQHLKSLAEAIRAHADLAQRLDLIVSIRGVGPRTAMSLVVRVPELGKTSREEAARLLGVAPVLCRSGKFKGEEHVEGGRARPRTSLFACAQAAIRHNDQLNALYLRLRTKGKHHSVAVMACARKLLIYINTVLARGTAWQPKTPSIAAA